MRNFPGILLMIGFISALASCAQREGTDDTIYQQMAFDAWMEENGPGPDVAIKQPNGMYIEFLAEGDASTTPTCDTTMWVRLDFTSTDLYNNVFATRSERQALIQGSFTPRTYYTPDYVFCGSENINMIGGRYYALKSNELVKDNNGTPAAIYQGSKVKLYIPPYLAYGSSGYSNDEGYGGQFPLTSTTAVPVIETIEVVETVKDPIGREEQIVKSKAEEWGLTIKDTLANYLYLDSVTLNKDGEYLGLKTIDFDPDQLLTVDSTAKIRYVGKFVTAPGEPEFICETNIQEVFDKFYYRNPNYTPDITIKSLLTYKPETDKDSYIPMFYDVVPKLRRGRWYRVVFTSAYGYGATGYSSAMIAQTNYYNNYMSYMMQAYYGSSSMYGNSYYGSYYNPYYNNMNYLNTTENEKVTEVQPYTPLIYELYIEDSE